jgi:O-succinylhomoserine sulfhydrylase
MCALEGAEACRATATGMAAVFASLMCQLHAGDRVVASRALFGSCQFVVTELLPRYGIETVIVDGTDLDQWKDALSKKTRAVFLETPSNPQLEIIDMAAVAELAHAAGARLVVDNVFATPILQRPMEFGADIVVYSATKHIDGQGRCLGGAILGPAEYCEDELTPFFRHTGPTMSPFNAWLLLKALETLELRMAAHCRNARVVAAFLPGRKGVERVLYPALPSHPQHDLAMSQMSDAGNVVSFDVEGGKEAAFRFLNALKLIDISNNLGDTKSLITHPATTTHQRIEPEERARMGIGEGLVRLSVGLEDMDDVTEDLAQATRRPRSARTGPAAGGCMTARKGDIMACVRRRRARRRRSGVAERTSRRQEVVRCMPRSPKRSRSRSSRSIWRTSPRPTRTITFGPITCASSGDRPASLPLLEDHRLARPNAGDPRLRGGGGASRPPSRRDFRVHERHAAGDAFGDHGGLLPDGHRGRQGYRRRHPRFLARQPLPAEEAPLAVWPGVARRGTVSLDLDLEHAMISPLPASGGLGIILDSALPGPKSGHRGMGSRRGRPRVICRRPLAERRGIES